MGERVLKGTGEGAGSGRARDEEARGGVRTRGCGRGDAWGEGERGGEQAGRLFYFANHDRIACSVKRRGLLESLARFAERASC